MRSSPSSITAPTVSNTARATASCAGERRDPAASPVTPRRTTEGVFGIARATGFGMMPSIVAVVTPAATLTTIASGSRYSAISSSSAGTIAGFTPRMTTRAPSRAVALASGWVSSAYESTPGIRTASALAVVRLVTATPSAASPESTSPARIAPPIEPAPRMAIRGRFPLISRV